MKSNKRLSIVSLLEADLDNSGDLSADELRDLADDLEGEPLTGEDLRDALISAISDMHKDIYGRRANATALRQLPTEELEQEHDKIDQQHKDWWYEERHREDQDMWIADEERETEELSEPEEGEDLPKFMGMGRGRMKENTMKITKQYLVQLIKEEISRVVEGEVIDFPQDPKVPWVFGPEGYIRRPELSQQYEKKEDVGADSPPEVMIARAMAYRASELTNYQQEFDDEIFSDYAMRIYQDYVLGKSGDKDQMLDSMLNRIDDGGWSDEDIMDIASAAEMSQTKDLASQQDSAEVEEMGMDFERFLQGIESGDVVELEKDDD